MQNDNPNNAKNIICLIQNVKVTLFWLKYYKGGSMTMNFQTKSFVPFKLNTFRFRHHVAKPE